MTAPTSFGGRVQINASRLWQSLLEMATVGATPEGGCERLALTDADRTGQELFAEWAAAAGCSVTRDRIGNLFAERAGRDKTAGSVLVGSHLDTQPNGGRFDGAYGVLAGLEVVRTLNDLDVETRAPIAVVSWANEEGARFPYPTTGSAVFSGALPLETAISQRSVDGPSFGEELARLGLAGAEEINPSEVAAYFEAHIEQGPRLETAGATIGVVRSGQGLRAVRAVVRGSASHAGTTPMDARRDALVGAAQMIGRVNHLASRFDEALVTVGELLVEPNSRSVIPGRVTMTIDARHHELSVVDALTGEVVRELESVAQELELDVESSTFLEIDPVVFDEECNQSVRRACQELDYQWLELVSGAVHDAMYLARVAPTALLFVPCRGGVSHNPQEYATQEHIAAGCEVLLRAALERAQLAS